MNTFENCTPDMYSWAPHFQISKYATVSMELQGVREKIAQSLCTTILQPYVTESCGFQENVQKKLFTQ